MRGAPWTFSGSRPGAEKRKPTLDSPHSRSPFVGSAATAKGCKPVRVSAFSCAIRFDSLRFNNSNAPRRLYAPVNLSAVRHRIGGEGSRLELACGSGETRPRTRLLRRGRHWRTFGAGDAQALAAPCS